MTNFIIGVVVGLVLATVGFSGVSKIADKGLEQTKTVIMEQAK